MPVLCTFNTKYIMQNWITVTLFLCLFGFLREIRPSEPFVTEFLLGEWRNVTADQVYQEVYPVGTYSYMALLVLVFLITDFLRFKPVIILSGLSGISVYAVLLWTESLEWLQVSQFLYGLYMATEVAYLTYIYAKVDSSKYPRVSSYTRIAALAGRSLSGIIAQLLIHFTTINYRDLNYITFTAQILATFWALCLPGVQYGIYFHRRGCSLPTDQLQSASHKGTPESNGKPALKGNIIEAASLISSHARAAYSRPRVVAWSALYACALALFVQAQTYMQMLWKEISQGDEISIAFNGAVEALLTLLGALGAFVAGIWPRAVFAAPASAIQALALLAATYTTNIYVSYAGYVVLGMLFHFVITLASAKIASQLTDESCFGLIFGTNTFIGTVLQSLLTLIMNQQLKLSVVMQFYTLSVLLMVVAVAWAVGWSINLYKQNKSINITI